MKKKYKNYYVHGERNRIMEKIKLPEELINYLATYLDEELWIGVEHPDKTTGELIEDAVDAFNGGAR